jgi:orotate phosphoribosyltransferase
VEIAELARRIYATAHLTGSFVLRSGQTTDEYFDKYRFEADPVLLDAIAEAMVPLVPADTEVLAGLEMGGIPVVTALGRRTGLPCAFVRKQAKPYGTRRLAEGAETAGRRVTIIEDVVTTGGQIVLSTEELRSRGADITNALCVINRNPSTPVPLTEAGLTLHALFSSEDLAAHTAS